MLNIKWKGSPNFWRGRAGFKPEAIVIHIMDGTLRGTDSWFANRRSQVSAHYGIGKNGEVHQYVKDEDTAWHAGVVVRPTWRRLKRGVNPNRYTIGIEHEGGATTNWTEPMKRASAALIKQIAQRWNIPIDREHIIGHYEIKATKPNCPAMDKGIIDELIRLAKAPDKPLIPPQVEEGLKKVEEGIRMIRQALT